MTPNEVPRHSVSIREAGELADVSRRTIYNWIRAGRLEYRRTAGGSIRIFEDSLFRKGELSVAPQEA